MGAERPPQQNQGLHKSKTVNGHVQHIPGQSPLSQVPPQHQHPSHHPMSMHPHAPPISHSQRRASPPPFASTLAPNNAYMQSQSPRPHLPPSLPPVHIGTFVYPRTPFPFLDFPPPPSDAINTPNGPVTFMEKEIREIRATVYIPSGFLPTKRPREPKIWGGALIPSFAPLFTTPQLVTHMQSGMPYDYRRLRTSGLHGLRRVYTDDSDLFLCALHAGWVKWSSARAARKEGKDLKLEVRLTREARYVGGFGSHYVGGSDDEEDFIGEDDGRTLLSAGWGNSHDGSGVEILNAEFVKRGTAHSLSARNRDQRLLEYADRHHTLTCTQHSRKRRRVLYQTADNDGLTDIEATDRKLSSDRTIILGGRAGWTRAGYVYGSISTSYLCSSVTWMLGLNIGLTR
ncbi:hypothetical protein BDW22DRAFT_1335810 [Trametopsis cervina]|nr:hypothetical protein BDW22DRAFT_1335810 [Trametopsis cervina]